MKNAMRALLYLLVGFGFYSSGRLAFRQWATGEACPVVGSVPACYVAFAGYAAMLIGLIAVTAGARMGRLFYGGLFVAGGLALVGTLMEVVKGNVCPQVVISGVMIPMCYISLAMSVLIGVLFWRVTVKLPEMKTETE